MMLRSATAASVQPHAADMTVVGGFIELRSDDATARPWLARVLATREVPGDAVTGESQMEVECEWLWHPQESIKDFGLEGTDSAVYGSREVFLGGGGGESTSDWNPMDSIKFRVYVFPLDVYKSVSAAGFQIQLIPDDPSSLTILDPTQCWYYRQTLDTESKILTPKLELTVHRPNPLFHQWCRTNNRLPNQPTPSDDQSIPPRTVLVPENVERLYFECTDCHRRFESRQGDCIAPELLSDPKLCRLKSDINSGDVTIVCPMCKSIKGDDPPPSKRARIDPGVNELWSDGMMQEDSQQRIDDRPEGKRKQAGRYERVAAIFETAIQEALSAGQQGLLKYNDARALADEFFDRFDAYSLDAQVNPKMEHQKLHEIFQNLKRENNVDLRRRIVTGELTIDELIHADVKDLAPQSLKKRREADAKKYFEQQVLLSAGPESLRVIRKTHKGLEEVQDEDHPRGPSPDSMLFDGEIDPPQLDSTDDVMSSSAMASGSSITSVLPVSEIIKLTIEKRRESGQTLIDIPFPLTEQWSAAPLFHRDPQVARAPQFLGLPNREQTRSLLLTKFNTIKLSDKMISDVMAYADLPSYRANC